MERMFLFFGRRGKRGEIDKILEKFSKYLAECVFFISRLLKLYISVYQMLL